MSRQLIHMVVGARPNYMKIAPLYKEFSKYDRYQSMIIHTGQHYDEKMSKQFFDDLELPKPDVYLQVGSGTHGLQTARIMERYEEYLLQNDLPDLVVVAGDVNSTLACALVAKKMQIAVAHLEAGLRSFDDRMPEEINRVLTDRIADILLTPSMDGNEHLISEGAKPERIHFVGNIMIDSLLTYQEKAKKTNIKTRLCLGNERYILSTLHRPSNVDDVKGLELLLAVFSEIGKHVKIVFPVHPRTRKNIQKLGLKSELERIPNIVLTDPLGYLDFIHLQMTAAAVLTDSGGIQEETTFFGIPCFTLRENTERPLTIDEGTNTLLPYDVETIVDMILDAIHVGGKRGTIPFFWDGKTAQRAFVVIDEWMASHR